MKIKLLDLFSGIGGFHLGLEKAGFEFDWVGFSEIDSFASKQYKRRFPYAKELGDITTIQSGDLPGDITILCGGFPCQAFSMAGKRRGFDDTRGTLFFEIARLLRHFKDIGKPIPYFVLENVKGLLSHDDGQTFATIYGVLTQLDYTIECQILNTKWFLPQNRERIYIVGHLGKPGRSKIFPIGENDARNRKVEFSRETTSKKEWDMQNIKNRGRYPLHRGKIKRIAGKYGQTTRWGVYDKNGISPTLTRAMGDGGGHIPMIGKVLRRLTPIECERLQGFPDGWTKGQSDTQRYKQLGNAVSVPVVAAVGDKIHKDMFCG